jgi:hypothetical protein
LKPSSNSWARTNARHCQSAAIRKILPTSLLYHVPRRISSPGRTIQACYPFSPITGRSRFASRLPMGYNRVIVYSEIKLSLVPAHNGPKKGGTT